MDSASIYKTLNRAYFSPNCDEKEVLEHLPMLLRDRSLVVDVGASLGQYTGAISKVISNSEILAIEADPVRAEELERNCRKWSAESTNEITALRVALSDEVGDVPYYVTNSDVSGGLFPHEANRPVDWEEITAESSTLDTLFPERHPDFVKIDVEGAELSILKGASRLLERGETIFLIELHDWSSGSGQARETIEVMRAAGYSAVSFFGRTVFVKSRRLWLKLRALDLRDPRRPLRRIRQR